jgi:hypothetical protein
MSCCTKRDANEQGERCMRQAVSTNQDFWSGATRARVASETLRAEMSLADKKIVQSFNSKKASNESNDVRHAIALETRARACGTSKAHQGSVVLPHTHTKKSKEHQRQ